MDDYIKCTKDNFDKACLVNIFNIISELPVGHNAKISEITMEEGCKSCIRPILHMLQVSGVLQVTNEYVTIISVTSSLFIKSLIEYITNDLTILSGWGDLKGKPEDISDKNVLLSEAFLYSMEKKRSELLGSEAKVIKTYDICRVVFKTKIKNKDCYLMQYGPRSNRYALIGGGIEPSDRNAYTAIIREISEELPEAGLEIDRNYKLKEIYKSESSAMSNKYSVYTKYNMTIYLAYDVDPKAIEKIDSTMNKWVSEDDIINEIAKDGKKIYPIKGEFMDALRTSAYSFKKGKFNSFNWKGIDLVLSIIISLGTIIGAIIALIFGK